VFSRAAKFKGEYRVEDLLPVVIGAKGVEKIVEVTLDPSERQLFEKSVWSVRDLVEACKTINPALANRYFCRRPESIRLRLRLLPHPIFFVRRIVLNETQSDRRR
jgi:hypothetical protein